MSFLRRGERRRGRVATAATTVGLLAAFQALAIVGAGVASAVTGCTFNPATGAVQITIDPNDVAYIAVESADDLDAQSPVGAILFVASGAYPPNFDPDANSAQCGSATNSNTTSIVVLGSPSGAEFFGVTEQDAAGGDTPGEFNRAITWAVDLGGATGDEFEIDAADDSDDEFVLTDSSFTFNGGGGPLLGVEDIQIFAGGGDDTIDGSALTTAVELLAEGEAGDDWIALGAHLTGDDADGGTGGEVNGDTLSYAHRTSRVVIDNVLGLAGASTDCDLLDAGDELDGHADFENFESGSGNDCLIGAAGPTEWWIPDGGDDDVTGQSADGDTIDFSGSAAAVTITMESDCDGSATGDGADTWTDVDAFYGSDHDDVLIWNSTCPASYFAGGDGVDTVDATTQTSGVTINLDTLDGGGATDTTDNALGGSSNDTLIGNDLRNRLEGNDGNDILSGAAGNDLLLGGAGNDTFTGGGGADKVSFINSPNGVNADLSLGFATGEGDDGFGDLVEIIVGSGFGDTITGGPFAGGGTVNFLFNGRGGGDVLTGYNGNDTLKGGGGDDILRGVAGDDMLLGARGNDLLVGGQGFDIGRGGPGSDECRGVENKKSC